MRYTKELHERVRQNLRMFDYPHFDDGDIDALLDEIDRLTAELEKHRWIAVSEKLPVNGKTYEVWVSEFGLGDGMAIAKCFISSAHPNDPRWYFDRDVYHLETNLQIAQTVTHYREINPPEQPKEDA